MVLMGVSAIYKNKVLRPLKKLDLKEGGLKLAMLFEEQRALSR